MDPSIRETILRELNPGLSTYQGYHKDEDQLSVRSAEIRKFVRLASRSGRTSGQTDKTGQSLASPPVLGLPSPLGPYTVQRELGAGTFAPVYLVENRFARVTKEQEHEKDQVDGAGHTGVARLGNLAYRRPFEAIKMENPPSSWEFYMIRQSHWRLGSDRATESIVRAHEMHVYRDECFLVEEFRDQGTLLDLVNMARVESVHGVSGGAGGGGGMDELLAMWLSVELLRVVEALHSKQLIHGDLKGDNVLVRFGDPGPETDWSATYFPNGAHGWASKGICLIDFGRGIDMRQFESQVGFIADWKTSEADCAEMRELRPWTYQIDYYGVAGILHNLLFGKYMETCTIGMASGPGTGAGKRYRTRENLKRYWQVELWSKAFDLLLNPGSHVADEEDQRLPVVQGIRRVREGMEAWLEENCEKGIGLKGMISRMELAVREKKRRL